MIGRIRGDLWGRGQESMLPCTDRLVDVLGRGSVGSMPRRGRFQELETLEGINHSIVERDSRGGRCDNLRDNMTGGITVNVSGGHRKEGQSFDSSLCSVVNHVITLPIYSQPIRVLIHPSQTIRTLPQPRRHSQSQASSPLLPPPLCYSH